MKTLILGIGNKIVTDDGVGIHIAERLMEELHDPNIDIRCESISGLGIIEVVRGYDHLIVVDAIQTHEGSVGKVYHLELSDLLQNGPTRHFATSHDVDIGTALELGQKLGEHVPKTISIYAVEVENLQDFSEECTPRVKAAIPVAVEMIKKELNASVSSRP